MLLADLNPLGYDPQPLLFISRVTYPPSDCDDDQQHASFDKHLLAVEIVGWPGLQLRVHPDSMEITEGRRSVGGVVDGLPYPPAQLHAKVRGAYHDREAV